jgi:DNA-binding response OmpR family regulator
MWATRITESVRRAGAPVVNLKTEEELTLALQADDVGEEPTVRGAVVDLNGRRYDAINAIGLVRSARLPVIAVAQHDDQVTRKRALSAGASRVFSYEKFFRDGTRLIEGWLTAAEPASE